MIATLTRAFAALAAIVLPGMAMTAHAATDLGGRAGLLAKLTSCAEVSDRDKKLSCFEATTAELKQAVAAGDVVMIDRQEAEDVGRQSFGFNLPSLSLFERGDRPQTLNSVTGRLASASLDGARRWTFRLEDGAVWSQVDGEMLLVQPRAGMPVEVRKGMIGSFFLSVDGHAGVRVRRVG